MLRRSIAVLAITLYLSATPTGAATRTWIGGNDPWDGDIFNWTGLDEPDDDDDVVFNTDNVVDMTIDNEILSLDLSNSIQVNTEAQFLDVNGSVSLVGSGTILRAGRNELIGVPATSLSAYDISIGNGATFQNAGLRLLSIQRRLAPLVSKVGAHSMATERYAMATASLRQR